MTKRISPTHYDVVGSYLRPIELKQAKADLAAGKIDAVQYNAIVDKAVAALIKNQKLAGLKVITDGEYRRTYWHLDFMWGFDGVGHQQTGGGVQFNGELAKLEDTFLTGKISYSHHPFIDDFKFTKQFEDDEHVAKLTVPAPAQLFQQMIVPKNYDNTLSIYASLNELIDDIAKAYQGFIQEFYSIGGRYLQFDDCTWGAIVGDAAEQRYKSLNLSLDDVKNYLLSVNNKALENRPEGLTVATHICRGNYHSTFFTSGPYDSVADYAFAKENVDTLYLEYDDARSGGFEPLAKVSENKHVVLGLITTKNAFLEPKDKIIERIREASKYIPLERLSLSPQCGFASCEVGNKLTEVEQWAKIRLVIEVAKEVWGE